ncbi:MAG: hypothetical protein ACODAU_11725, partial [Myxococcota bacterium]
LGAMSHSLLLPLVALAGSLVLFFDARMRWLAVVATVAAAIWLAQAAGWLSLSVRGLPLGTFLAAALVIAGVMMVLRSHRKMSVIAATLVAAIGGMQLIAHL